MTLLIQTMSNSPATFVKIHPTVLSGVHLWFRSRHAYCILASQLDMIVYYAVTIYSIIFLLLHIRPHPNFWINSYIYIYMIYCYYLNVTNITHILFVFQVFLLSNLTQFTKASIIKKLMKKFTLRSLYKWVGWNWKKVITFRRCLDHCWNSKCKILWNVKSVGQMLMYGTITLSSLVVQSSTTYSY